MITCMFGSGGRATRWPEVAVNGVGGARHRGAMSLSTKPECTLRMKLQRSNAIVCMGRWHD